MSYSATLFILVFLNLFAAGIFIYSLLKIPATRVRRAFFGFLISTTFWINFVFLTKMTGLSESELIVISRIIFSFIAVAIGSFGYFIIIFTEQTGELRKPRFWIFVTFGVFFIIASFSGYVENGIKFNESGPSPVYGILHPFLVSFYFICGIYIFLIAHSVYRNTQSESLKYQLQILFWCGLATFLVAGFFNGILPYIAGNSRYSYFGPIGFFVIYLGIFNILRNENTLFLKKEISRFLQEPPFQIQENVFAFRELLGHLNYFFKNNPDRMKKRLGFLDENLQNTGVYLVRDGKSENNALGDSINSQSKVPIGWMQGLYDSVVNLNKDNRRLAFALIRAESDMNETLVPKRMEMPEKFLQLPEKENYFLSNYISSIEENLRDNKDTFGVDLISFSVKFQRTLGQIQSFAKSQQSVLFSGPTGSGRFLLVKAMHFNRGGGELIEISCQADTKEMILKKREDFLKLKPSKNPPGLVLKNLEYLPLEYFPLIEPFMGNFSGKKFVYFTCSSDFINGIPAIPANILHGIKQVTINLNPLHERPEDIFYQTLYFMNKYSKLYGKEFLALSKSLMDFLKKHTWNGNSLELDHLIHRTILETKPPVIEKLNNVQMIENNEEDASTDSLNLSPLELAERKIILQYLQGNKFNKNRTRKDLQITINTLNAKIIKYGIVTPAGK